MASWALCLAVVLAVLAGAVGDTGYTKFLRQHVDYPRTTTITAHRYCETMLARRRVTAPGRPCKPTNTFVHAPASELVNTCSPTAGEDVVQRTPRAMDITVCRVRGGNTRPPCSYRMQQLRHHVLVNCRGGLPVHLAGTSASLGED